MRFGFVARAYGWREGLRSLPRTVTGNIIAMMAARRALGRYLAHAAAPAPRPGTRPRTPFPRSCRPNERAPAAPFPGAGRSAAGSACAPRSCSRLAGADAPAQASRRPARPVPRRADRNRRAPSRRPPPELRTTSVAGCRPLGRRSARSRADGAYRSADARRGRIAAAPAAGPPTAPSAPARARRRPTLRPALLRRLANARRRAAAPTGRWSGSAWLLLRDDRAAPRWRRAGRWAAARPGRGSLYRIGEPGWR